jgi:dethiobiotin synthetase
MTARALFVAGAGTDVGKTYIAANLLRGLKARGIVPAALKPVMSGFDPRDVAHCDAGVLLEALGRLPSPSDIAEVAPFRFVPALPPTIVAAREEDRKVSLEEIVEACQQALDGGSEFLVIEGVGGVMSPIARKATVLDLITALDVPTLLVGGSYLGAATHTLTALAALDACAVPVAGVVVSESEASTVSLRETARLLADFIGTRKLVTVRRNGDASLELSALALGLQGLKLKPAGVP